MLCKKVKKENTSMNNINNFDHCNNNRIATPTPRKLALKTTNKLLKNMSQKHTLKSPHKSTLMTFFNPIFFTHSINIKYLLYFLFL